MPDPFDTARRSLEEVPVPDLWEEAQRRASDEQDLPLTSASHHPAGRPGRWLAVAAAAAVLVGTVVVLVDDDGADSVKTSPAGDPAAGSTTVPGPPIATSVPPSEDDGCGYGLSGEPIELEKGPADPPVVDIDGQRVDASGRPGDTVQQGGDTVTHAQLGSQVAEIHVPSLLSRSDLAGERVEEIQLLDRDPATRALLWFGADFVQVRYSALSSNVCDSFTVIVAGGTEDANRHLAVDLAERMVFDSDLEGPPLGGTDWQLERSTVRGVPTDGNGATFRFSDTGVSWTDGCNEHRAGFRQTYEVVEVGDITSTKVRCPANPTADAIAAVMSADAIYLAYEYDFVLLQAGDVTLTLRPGGG